MKGADFTMSRLLQVNSKRWPDAVWMRKKQSGLWHEYTWKDSYEKVKHLSLGLMGVGLRRGEAVCILGESDPQWLWAEIAAQIAGGNVVAVPPQSSPERIREIIQSLGVTVVVAQDQEQVDKVLEIKPQLSELRKIIFWNSKAMRGYDDPVLADFGTMVELGRRHDGEHPGLFDEAVVRGGEYDTALLQYDTADLRPAPLTHAALTKACREFCSVDPVYSKDEWFCSMPPGSFLEQVIALNGSLQSGMKLNFPENPYTTQQDIREIGPTLVLNPPEFWVSLGSNTRDMIEKSTFLKRRIYRLLFPVGERIAARRLRGEKPGPWLRVAGVVTRVLLLRPLKARLGLANTRRAYSSGPVSDGEACKILASIGLDLRQLEVSDGIITSRRVPTPTIQSD